MKKNIALFLSLVAFAAKAQQVSPQDPEAAQEALNGFIEQHEFAPTAQRVFRHIDMFAKCTEAELQERYTKLSNDYETAKKSYATVNTNYIKGKAKCSDLQAAENILRFLEEELTAMQLYGQVAQQAQQASKGNPATVQKVR